MRVTLKRSSTGVGYFPGLAKPVVLDGSALSESDLARLEKLVTAANFFDQPADEQENASATRGAADHQQQALTVEWGDKTHTVNLSDLRAKTPAMRELLSFIEQKIRQ